MMNLKLSLLEINYNILKKIKLKYINIHWEMVYKTNIYKIIIFI